MLSVLDWAPAYNRAWLRGDVIAGCSVAALVVPKSLGYAGMANIPIEHGLYAAAAGTILYALIGPSRQTSTQPSASLAAIPASAMAIAGISGGDDSVAFVAGIALVAGLLFMVMTILKMGWIAQFISRAVIVGFLCGAAIDVSVGELQKITGTDASGENVWQELWSWVGTLDSAHGTTLIVGLLALTALFGLHIVAPKLPGTLLVVLAGLATSKLFDLGDLGVTLVGHVPRGLPGLVVPDPELLINHAAPVGIAAVAVVLIGFSQSAGGARAFGAKHGYRVDIDQEAFAQGASNVAAGLFQGMPVSISLSASALNDNNGARSQLASLVTGGVVILTMIVFAPLFSDLPAPVLGAVIIDAALTGMIDLPELRRMFRVQRTDFWIAVAAILGVIFFGILAGIVIGVILSVGWLVHTVTSPAMPVLGREYGTNLFREIELHPEDEQFPGTVVIGIGGGIFFATADALGDRFREVTTASDEAPTAVILDFRSVNVIDTQGTAQLRELIEYAHRRGIELRLAQVKPNVIETLARDGVITLLGADNIYDRINEAIDDHSSASTTTTAASPASVK
jgi:sulfate permease, SulP family